MKKQLSFLLVLLINVTLMFGQDQNTGSEEGEIDSSKPTNFYSFLDNTLEYSSQKNQNIFGYRGKLTLALS